MECLRIIHRLGLSVVASKPETNDNDTADDNNTAPTTSIESFFFLPEDIKHVKPDQLARFVEAQTSGWYRGIEKIWM